MLSLLVISTLLFRALVDAKAACRILFGPCAHLEQEFVIFYPSIEEEPNDLIFIGHNVYGDTCLWQQPGHEGVAQQYKKLGSVPGFK